MNATIRGSLPLGNDARLQNAYEELDSLVQTLIDREFEDEVRRVRRALMA